VNPTPFYSEFDRNKRPPSDTLLGTWLKAQGISAFHFARLCGCDPKMVILWASDRSTPSLHYAFKIEQVSEGAVHVSSWLGTALGKARWDAMGADWESLTEQRRAEMVRNTPKRKARARLGMRKDVPASKKSKV
jgi:transcriptional regulator with XRE-family HTH domain